MNRITTKNATERTSVFEISLSQLLRRLTHGEAIRPYPSEMSAMNELVGCGYAVASTSDVNAFVATGKANALARKEEAERLPARMLVPRVPKPRKARIPTDRGPALVVPGRLTVLAVFQALERAGGPVFIGELSDPPDPNEAVGFSSPGLTAWYVAQVVRSSKWRT